MVPWLGRLWAPALPSPSARCPVAGVTEMTQPGPHCPPRGHGDPGRQQASPVLRPHKVTQSQAAPLNCQALDTGHWTVPTPAPRGRPL